MIKSISIIISMLLLGCSSIQQKKQDDIVSPINKQFQDHPSSTEGDFFSAFIPTEKTVIMNFEDPEIHDKDWFLSQQEGYTGLYLEGKKNSGVNQLSIAIGEGRNGSNALLVESLDESMGLPSFWITKALNSGGYATKIKNKEGYFIPSNIKANRLEFWLKFENGFRYNKASAYPPFYPNHQNLLVGTYHFDPSKINGTNAVEKSDNWNFYHRVFLRHDQAGEEWIQVIVNQQPQKQRSFKNAIPNNPTMPAGNYYNLLTRLSIDLAPYFSDPETSYPIKMWVDDVSLSYVPERPDLTIDFLDHSQGDIINVYREQERILPVYIKNNKAEKVCGVLSINSPKWLNPQLIGSEGVEMAKTICLDANSSEMLSYRVLPNENLKVGQTNYAGLTFVNEETMLSDSESTNRSLTDSYVEKRWFSETGSHDSIVSSDFIRLKIASEDEPLIVTTVKEAQRKISSAFKYKIPKDFIATEKFVVMDFEDSEIHDEDWFLSQEKGYSGFFVQGKKDSGINKLSVAIGEGRKKGNALLVESTDESMGLPGFWILKALNDGYASRFKDKEGYFLPGNLRANRLEFWVKFEKGFRNNSSSAQPPSYPNHQNLHIGTYQFDPSKIDGDSTVIESDNWHFYHQVFLRHDKAEDGWIHVVINQQPQHQRSIKQSLPNNPTMPAGNYFELLTRVYFDLHPYFSDPELSYPIKMWVDDVTLSYVPEHTGITVNFLDYSQGETISANRNEEVFLPVTLTNNRAKGVCGTLSINTAQWLNPKLIGDNGDELAKTICLDANSSKVLSFRVLANESLPIGKTDYVGLTFVDNETILSDSESTNRSLTEANVEKRWFADTGAHDSIVSSDFIRLKIQ